jgi:arginine N-succinyltransferase
MAGMRGRFEKNVIAEMRGVIGRSGHSPFWEGLGKHFFETEFAHADYLSMKDKTFIAELMPVHPIYIDLLPAGAREVIGQVHPDTRPALGLLEGEGFEFTGRVDIFEGGPIVGCPLGDIRTVRESAVEIVSEVVSNPGETGGPGDAPAGECILSNVRLDFRACLGAASPAVGEGVRIPRPVSEAPQVEAGDRIRIAALRPPRPDEDRA